MWYKPGDNSPNLGKDQIKGLVYCRTVATFLLVFIVVCPPGHRDTCPSNSALICQLMQFWKSYQRQKTNYDHRYIFILFLRLSLK